jgi:arylamine N-acetyltransferase
MLANSLNRPEVDAILAYLGCPARKPSLTNLKQLVAAYVHHVPWESVTRLIKYNTLPAVPERPRWPDEFWQDALNSGTGGTCYESSLAFYSLLVALGYHGYLTVNDMGQTRGCHAAIIIQLGGQKYLVDVTIPILAVLPVQPQKKTRRMTPFHTYFLVPYEENIYQVERTHHPERNVFTLIDQPVSPAQYHAVMENDYTPAGHFLTSLVIVKVIGNQVWRYFSDRYPYMLESFNRVGKQIHPLPPTGLARALAERFKLPEEKIAAALGCVNLPPPPQFFY